jgi:predicted RNA-binding Zn-ribbon protein involved in translation (DUF1610 family)
MSHGKGTLYGFSDQKPKGTGWGGGGVTNQPENPAHSGASEMKCSGCGGPAKLTDCGTAGKRLDCLRCGFQGFRK